MMKKKGMFVTTTGDGWCCETKKADRGRKMINKEGGKEEQASSSHSVR